MTKATLEGIEIGFVSGGMRGDPVRLRGLYGRERISRLFEFDLLLTRPKPFSDEELDGLLKAPCAVAMGLRSGDVAHGILQWIRLIDHGPSVDARYLARMVPSVWLLTQARTSRAYHELRLPQMVAAVLGSYGMGGAHFEMRVVRDDKSPVHEYIVQYQESDWDFLQRWLEREGFFYWFSHGRGGEKLIIADENVDATPIEAPVALSYRERNNVSTGGEATIWDWGLLQRRIPAHVALYDYNYRNPGAAMMVVEEVDGQRGFGSVFSYGEHFKDTTTGQAVAKLRAERIRCERRTYSGVTDCARFRVGHTFELENHHDPAHDGKYLITSMEHRVGYPILDARGELGDAPVCYRGEFEAIPFGVPYRPERVTPWPRIHGVMHAHVDADTSGEYAQIDPEGRYKVKMPYDVSGGRGGRASRWIRMAQPYAGQGYGSHFPLHKGAEVLVAHVDGDPDRPILLGAVPNPHTPSPSTSANATQSVTQTASGIRVELEDLQG